MKIDQAKWKMIKKLFLKASFSSMHYSIATTNSDGTPHVTPIGSLFLTELCKGFYFEEYAYRLKRNMEHNSRVCVLAVNSSKIYWLRSIIKGSFSAPFSIRLMGTAEKRRDATQWEYDRLDKMIGRLKWSRGYRLLWNNLKIVRDINFHSFEPVRAGKMSAHLLI